METPTITNDNHKPGISGMKVALIGDAGTGKTHSLHSLAEAGLEIFAILTEPCMDVIADIPSEQLHWNYISPSTASWNAMEDSARKINTMAFKALSELPHVNRGEHSEYLQIMALCDNFIDQRTGKEFGSVDNFGTNQVLWIDSWSGISYMAMNLIAGSKPIRHVGDYGVSMDNLERFAIRTTQNLWCHLVVVCHPAREKDELTGGTSMMIDTIGQKLAPKLPKLFTDIINTQRIEGKFHWSTITPNMTLKARNLPWDDNLPPSFVPLVKNWKEKDRLSRL